MYTTTTYVQPTVLHTQPSYVVVQQQPTYIQQPTYVQTIPMIQYIPASQYALGFGFQWQSGLCACMEDTTSCCEVIFCGYCQLGYQKFYAQYGRPGMDSTACVCALILDMFCTFGLAFAAYACGVRQRVTARYGIIEAGIENCFFGFCCPQCSLCQTFREMDTRGEFPGGCCVLPGANAAAPGQQQMGGAVTGSPVAQGSPTYTNNQGATPQSPGHQQQQYPQQQQQQQSQQQQYPQQQQQYPPQQQQQYPPQQQYR